MPASPDRLATQLARLEDRARLDRLAGRPGVPTPARIAIRITRWCLMRGVLASTCLAAHRAALAGLPHDVARAALYRRAAIVAHRRD